MRYINRFLGMSKVTQPCYLFHFWQRTTFVGIFAKQTKVQFATYILKFRHAGKLKKIYDFHLNLKIIACLSLYKQFSQYKCSSHEELTVMLAGKLKFLCSLWCKHTPPMLPPSVAVRSLFHMVVLSVVLLVQFLNMNWYSYYIIYCYNLRVLRH